jgi:hypothetical protein
MRRRRTCEACGERRLSARTKGDVCARCREDGAEFARAWMEGLSASGLTAVEIAPVVGYNADTVRARLSDRRAAA